MDPVNERSEAFAKLCLQKFEEMKATRASREPELQMICDYIFPRRDFSLTKEPQALRTRRLMDTTGMIAHERLAATIYGYMLSPHSPWTMPSLLERDATYEEDAWFDHVSRRNHTWFGSASNTFRVCMAEDSLDITGLGTSVSWEDMGPRGPVYISIPLRQCYWLEDENGTIDTLHRFYQMTLRRAILRWPDSPGLQEMMTKTERPQSQMVDILHVVEPRENGVRGSVRDRKPWRDVNVLVDKTEVLEVGGHERFKYNVGRFQKRSGDPLGYGAAWKAMPLCKLASSAMEAWVRNAEKAADPAKWTLLPRSTSFDRRPGAMNYPNAMTAFGLRDASKLIQNLDEGGNTQVAVEMLMHIHTKIEQAFYVDWLTPGEGPQKTATEVYDLRDMRLRTMGPIVARLEHEKLNTTVENTFEFLQGMGFYDPPPASLDKEMISFEFRGPLATSQRQGEAEGIMRALESAAQVAQLDPDVLLLFKGADTTRRLVDAYGMDGDLLNSPEVYEEKRAKQAEVGQMQEEMMATQAAATALRDGAQGVASLQGAQGGAAA
ncbi:portal protein [Hyphomonas sp.]|jgi:hypothetical protein|uniref:portal protein n=1 Tax=Hyphomonas sp. TaxID=87 RepID=UPI0032EDDC61